MDMSVKQKIHKEEHSWSCAWFAGPPTRLCIDLFFNKCPINVCSTKERNDDNSGQVTTQVKHENI